MDSDNIANQRRSLRVSSNEKRKRESIILSNYKIEFDACNSARFQTNQERIASERSNLRQGTENETQRKEKSLFIDEFGSNKPICSKPSSKEEEPSSDYFSVQTDPKYYKLDAYERTIFKLSGNHLPI